MHKGKMRKCLWSMFIMWCLSCDVYHVMFVIKYYYQLLRIHFICFTAAGHWVSSQLLYVWLFFCYILLLSYSYTCLFKTCLSPCALLLIALPYSLYHFSLLSSPFFHSRLPLHPPCDHLHRNDSFCYTYDLCWPQSKRHKTFLFSHVLFVYEASTITISFS